MKDSPILFYDGDCGFCQNSVQFFLKHEKNHHFLFASLQGSTGKEQLPEYLTRNLDSLVVKQGETILTESDAVIFIAKNLSFPYSLAKIGKYVPKRLRNGIYRMVARNRHKLSKTSESCRLLSKNERLRFLD